MTGLMHTMHSWSLTSERLLGYPRTRWGYEFSLQGILKSKVIPRHFIFTDQGI
jgi:hypothetical protein